MSLTAKLRGDNPQIFLQRLAEIDVACERVDFLAVDEQLHRRDRGKIRSERVYDRIDRQQLVLRSTRVCGRYVFAQVDERCPSFVEVQSPKRGARRNRGYERSRGRGELRRHNLLRLCCRA